MTSRGHIFPLSMDHVLDHDVQSCVMSCAPHSIFMTGKFTNHNSHPHVVRSSVATRKIPHNLTSPPYEEKMLPKARHRSAHLFCVSLN